MAKKPPTLTAVTGDGKPVKKPAAGKKSTARKTAPPKRRQPRKGQPGIPPPGADELAQQRERDMRAVDLALSGLSYEAIARELGYADKSGSYRAVRRALDRQEAPKVAEMRELENARLDRLQTRLWDVAMGDDNHLSLRASDRLLRLFERRARLNGLDQQVARDVGALADSLLGDPEARRARLVALRGALDEAMTQQDGTG